MTISYRCRTTLPELSDWREVSAASPEEAANEFHLQNSWLKSLSVTKENRERVYFARVEVEGLGSWISRYFWSGITRKGRKPRESLKEQLQVIATKLEYGDDPMTLIAEGWYLEEEYPSQRNCK